MADNFFVGHFGDGSKTEITNLKLCHLCKCNFLNCFLQLWCMNKYVPFRQNHESTVVGPRWTWGHFPNWLFNSRAKKVRNEKKTWIVRSQNSTVRISKIYLAPQKNCRKKTERIKLTWYYQTKQINWYYKKTFVWQPKKKFSQSRNQMQQISN